MRFARIAMLFAMTLCAGAAAAQEQRGSVEGIVRDASGAVLPGVAVTLEGASGVKLETTSGGEGIYRFPSVGPGLYRISANLQGFNPGKVEAVQVSLGEVRKVDFGLALAGVTENVQVTAQSPSIDVPS